MCCAVATEEVQRKKAYPTVHAFPASRRHRFKGTIWADQNTAPIHKFRNRKPKKKSSSLKDDFTVTETEDIALRNEIRQAMQVVSQRNMNAILPYLRSIDKANKGKLTFDKVKHTLQTNQISLSETGFRNLGKKFGEKEEDLYVVRYEMMISYLTKLWAEAAALPKKKPTTPPAAGFSNTERIGDRRSYATRSSYVGADPNSVKIHNRATFESVDELQFLADLQKELSNLSSMADLKNKMCDFDLDENGFLNEGQVYASFRSCSVYLSPEVFQQLLNAVDTTSSFTYNIEAIISYLLRVRPDLQYQVASRDRRKKMYDHQAFPSINWDETPTYPAEEDVNNFDDFLNDLRPENDDDDSFDANEWSIGFQALVAALHRTDENKSGFLEEDEVRRIAQTYILVHNLGVSDTNMNAALHRAYDHKVKEVNLDKFASILEEYHFKYILDNLK